MKIVTNPPYCKNLHLKILQEALKYSEDIIALSPVRWLQDPLAEYKKNSDFKKFYDIRKHISSLDIVSCDEANRLFGIIVSTDLGIYSLDDKQHNIDLRSKLVQKLFETNCHYEKFDINQKDGWRVRFAFIDNCKSYGSSKDGKIRFQRLLAFKDGMRDGKPWYEYFSKNGWSKETDYIPVSLEFSTEEECNNFIDVMTKTKLGRYYWITLQQDMNVLPCFFLKLDYSHPWTDSDLYKYFGLSSEEISIIENAIK